MAGHIKNAQIIEKASLIPKSWLVWSTEKIDKL